MIACAMCFFGPRRHGANACSPLVKTSIGECSKISGAIG